MAVKKEVFCEEKIKKIKKHLEFYHAIGEPIDFEIVIDDFKCVRRTDNPSYFDNYKLSIESNTQEMIIRLFTGTSNNCDKVIFYWQDQNIDYKSQIAIK